MSRLLWLTLSWVVCLAACSAVDVRKVPTPTQYVVWTDEMQQQADSITGFRFYLPRPFINVFESFPVRTDIYLAQGRLSDDGKSVRIDEVIALEDLATASANKLGWNSSFSVDSKWVMVPDTTTPKDKKTDGAISGQSKSGEEEDTPADSGTTPLQTLKDALEVEKQLIPETPPSDPTVQPSQTEPESLNQPLPLTGGKTNENISTDNFAFAYQPMRGHFDIAYLPDFEEQYAIEKREGLGDVEFNLNLGQGWSLQSYNALVDNSELTKRIFDVLDVGAAAAKAALGDIGGLADVADTLTEPAGTIIGQSKSTLEDLAKNKNADLSRPVTLKIIVVHYASKGLYPIIKPRELQIRKVHGVSSEMTVDMFAKLPKAVFSTEYDGTQIEKAAQHSNNLSGQFTVPRYPYQYISFNTFRYLAIELVDGNKDPFEHLYDRTGTQGEVGAGDSGNLANIIQFLDRAKPSSPDSSQQTVTSPDVCTDKQTDVWSKLPANSPYVVAGDSTNGLVVKNPSFLKTTFAGDINIVGSFNAKEQIGDELAIKNHLIDKLNNDPHLKSIGCKNLTLGPDIRLSSYLSAQLAGTAKGCQRDNGSDVFQCVIKDLSFPIKACDSQINLKYKKFQGDTLTINATPEKPLCKNILTSFSNLDELTNFIEQFIRRQQEATTGNTQSPILQTLIIENKALLEQQFEALRSN